MKRLNCLILITLFTFLITACGGGDDSKKESGSSAGAEIKGGQASVQDDLSEKNIVQIAAGSEDHTTLVTAITAAGMADVLANPGPLTVFAPTNEAFAKLPYGTVENLLKAENKKTLMRIITNHATPGTYTIEDLEDGMVLGQATGVNVTVEVTDDVYYVGGAKILGSVDASNGVVHVVDAVLLPPE
jgi:uncharacterized surface protein with fasciclin (FAS1) repeats